jgi:hypothetical protein
MKYKLLKKTAHLGKGNIVADEFLNQKDVIIQLLLDLGYIQEYEPNKKWEPKEGGGYYFVDYDGKVKFTEYWHDYPDDRARKEIGNCFQTREEAEAMAEKFKALLKQERGTTTD